MKWSILHFTTATTPLIKQRNSILSGHKGFTSKFTSNSVHVRNKRAMSNRGSQISVARFSSHSLPWVQSLATSTSTTTGTGDTRTTKIRTSIFSWNILAQYLFDSTQKWYRYVSPEDPVHNWNERWPSIEKEIRRSHSDIVCLQEVEFSAFERDILPSMREMGYDGIMQDSRKRNEDHGYGVATFWNSNRFHLCDVSHRSRTMLTTLADHNCFGGHLKNDDDGQNQVIAVLNCHLEGNPTKAVTRVRQLQNSLHELKRKFVHHHLVICGDFNCQLGQSACSTYLHYGSCPSHIPILEFGRELEQAQIDELDKDIRRHEYNLYSAYPIELMNEDPLEYITFANAPGHFTVGLDQIWYHSNLRSMPAMSDVVIGLKSPFHSLEHRNQVIQHGLPSRFHPSDHMPIGCILEWEAVENDRLVDLHQLHGLDSSSSHEEDDKEKTKEALIQEIAELLDACPFTSNEQRMQFEFIISPVEGMKSGHKPTSVQIEQIRKRRELKKILWSYISDDVKQILERIIVLTKDASKLT